MHIKRLRPQINCWFISIEGIGLCGSLEQSSQFKAGLKPTHKWNLANGICGFIGSFCGFKLPHMILNIYFLGYG